MNPKWRIAATKPLVNALHQTIAIDRFNAHIARHPGEAEPSFEEFRGPPFTDAEQAYIDEELARNRINRELYAWVSSMGLLQYALAPVALLLSLTLMWRSENRMTGFSSAACAFCNVIAICLMIYRGYFTSLGL